MRRQRRVDRREGVNRRISPVAAAQGRPLTEHVERRCSCPEYQNTASRAAGVLNPTCPVHGDGRPAGRGV